MTRHDNLNYYSKNIMTKASKTKNAPVAFAETPVNPPAHSFPASSGLQLLFEENIKCLYWIENHLIKSLPKMISAAGNPVLKKALTTHLKLTIGHAERLVKVFGMLNRDVLSKKSDAMEGLAMDGEHTIEETQAGTPERKTGLIMAGRLVENYEMTAYKGVIQLADQLGLADIAGILNETLIEEQEADKILSELAEKK
jgi:ferritin-like metal-binding protein YciE